MKIKIFVFTIIYLVLHSTNAYAMQKNTTWIMHIAIDPSWAWVFNGAYFNRSIDITRYKYPLYVGYFYKDENNIVHVKCIEKIAEKDMNKWAKYQTDHGGCAMRDFSLQYKNKPCLDFFDEDYVLIAQSDLQWRYGFRTIKVELDKKPDDNWRPQFKKQFTIDFPVDDSPGIQFKLDRVLPSFGSFEILN